MMQEEELNIRDENKHFAQLENYAHNAYGHDIHPFTISDGVLENSAKRYSFTPFELFVTAVVMLSTISGGFLEGYTSSAIPYLLETSNLSYHNVTNISSNGLIYNDIVLDENSTHLDAISTQDFPFKLSVNKSNSLNAKSTDDIPLNDTKSIQSNLDANFTQNKSFNSKSTDIIPLNGTKSIQSYNVDTNFTQNSSLDAKSTENVLLNDTKSIQNNNLDSVTQNITSNDENSTQNITFNKELPVTHNIGLDLNSTEAGIHLSEVMNNTTDDGENKQIGAKVRSNTTDGENGQIGFEEIDVNTAEPEFLSSTKLDNELHTTTAIVEDYISTAIFNVIDDGIGLPENSTDVIESLPIPLPLSDNINETPEQEPLHITEEEGSWLGSLLLLGAALGAFISPWVIRLGRRHAIMASAIPRFAGWILIVCSTSVYTFYAGRFLAGVSLGAVSCATPIYISEIAHPSLRGSLNLLVLLGVNVGIFVSVLLGTFLSWKSLAIVGAVTVLGYFIPTIFIPNSPSWLVLRGRENEARAVLRSLRGEECVVEGELQQIVTVTDKADKRDPISWSRLLRERRTLLPLSAVLLVSAVNRLSGYNAIMTYCSVFINDAVPAVSQYWSAVGVCLVQMLSTLGAMSVVDLWGRRKLLVLSVLLMGLSLLGVGVCESVVSREHGGTWLAVIATMVYVGSYSLGVGPLTWVLLGELFPLDARDKASAIVATSNWLLAFLVTKTYFALEAKAGIAGTCYLYASVCLVGLVFIYFLVPETKGRTLAEIEAHFSYRQSGWFPKVHKFDQALAGIMEQESSYSTFH